MLKIVTFGPRGFMVSAGTSYYNVKMSNLLSDHTQLDTLFHYPITGLLTYDLIKIDIVLRNLIKIAIVIFGVGYYACRYVDIEHHSMRCTMMINIYD